MAGSLIKIDEEIVSGTPTTVQLLGIDSTYDVYLLQFHNVVADTDNKDLYYRFTVSGTADSSSNYDYAAKELRTDTSFQNRSANNQTYIPVNISGLGTGTGEAGVGNIYAFNFNNSSEYSFVTFETNIYDFDPRLMGWQGGGVLTETQITNGFEFFWESSVNFASGTFSLYGLKK